MKVTVSTSPNIAIIKYWGKRCEDLNLPLNSSYSVTLNQEHLKTTTTAEFDSQLDKDQIIVQNLQIEGKHINQDNKRVRNCLKTIREIVNKNGKDEDEYDVTIHPCVRIWSQNNFPTAAGLASSASGYAALVTSLAKLYDVSDDVDISMVARRGSGSATRSMKGGFVEWNMGNMQNGDDSRAIQHHTCHHWPQLRVFILVTSSLRKQIGSTEAMQRSVMTSSLLKHRVEFDVPRRLEALKSAVTTRNFPSFARITMEESNQLHAICQDSFPPVFYLNQVSRQIINFVHAINETKYANEEIIAAYTFDAGPNCFIFTLDKYAGLLASLLLHYFPPHTNHTDEYMRGLKYPQIASPYEDDINFQQQPPGSLQYIISTNVGGDPCIEVTK